jgi:hypothetical protein
MSMDQVTSKFEFDLCALNVARVRAATDMPLATPLPCTVSTRAGSVIATATTVLPSSIAASAVSAAVEEVSANLAADIASTPTLAALGDIDPVAVRQELVTIPASAPPTSPITPVISQSVSLRSMVSPAPSVSGITVTLYVTFVTTTAQGTRQAQPMTGFIANDVLAVAASSDGRILPVAVTLSVASYASYMVDMTPAASWADVDRRSCETMQLTVGVAAGGAMRLSDGQTNVAAANVSIPWIPGGDGGACDDAGQDSNKGSVRLSSSSATELYACNCVKLAAKFPLAAVP